MPRDCGCSGGCGGDMSRRDFLKVAGMGATSMLLPLAADAAVPNLQEWQAGLQKPGEPRLYHSNINTEARMHFGGVGTGNIELGVDGQFTTWNLFNTLAEGQVPLHFALRAGTTARLLQTAGGPDVARVANITMRGEYPLAELDFEDPALPVHARLRAMTPLVPLDERASSMPVIHLEFEIQNPTGQEIPISLAGWMLNPVGYEGTGRFGGTSHPMVGFNFNQFQREGNLALLHLKAHSAPLPALAHPVMVYTNRSAADFVHGLNELPAGLTFHPLSELPDTPVSPAAAADGLAPNHSPLTTHQNQIIIWLDSPDANLEAAVLRRALHAVQNGAALIITGAGSPLLSAYGLWTRGQNTTPAAGAGIQPEIVIEDFESGTYRNWTVEGNAFGKAPSRGTEAGQQAVSGFSGHFLVNSFEGGDGPQGRMLSQPFTIQRRYIRLLVGGGASPETAVRLLVGGKVVHTASGKDAERLEPVMWNVANLQGQEAQIEIIDRANGGWGHINVDDIVQSDTAGNEEALALLTQLLPAHFSGLTFREASIAVPYGGASGNDASRLSLPGHLELETFSLAADSKISTSVNNSPVLLERAIGQGRSLLFLAPLWGPGANRSSLPRMHALAFLSAFGGVPAPIPTGLNPEAPGTGSFVLAANAPDTSASLAISDLRQSWEQFSATGRLDAVQPGAASPPSPAGQSYYGGLAIHAVIPAGGTLRIPFTLAWRYPNFYASSGQNVGNYYATLWKDPAEAARELDTDPHHVIPRTLAFRDAMYNSTLPYWLLDCFTSQLGISRHIGVVFRLAAGDIYGWEGSNGCCQPTCTHVWGYEQSLSRVFPSLERQMREIDYKHQQQPDGGIHNRTEWPSPPRPTGEQPFADGHASCILKAYRESLNTPQGNWLKEYWPNIRQAVDYLIMRDAAGGEPDGILEDDQFNTYDDAIHGPNSFIGTYYLAALRAGEEMALRMGDQKTAARYHAIFEKGQQKLVELCWNGDYFQQNLPGYAQRSGEYGPGCLSDQLIGQWWAHLLGLGYVVPQEHVRKALRSIFANNWLPDMSNWRHNQRWFAGGNDKGLLICTWPRGGRPPRPIPYVDEVWTGVEYQVAGLMVYEGMLTEALSIAKGARDRYDGVPRPPMQRNPWSELECGGHYARAMSSWGLLLVLSGFYHDGPNQFLRFGPRITPEKFQSIFTAAEAWGSVVQNRTPGQQTNQIQVSEGAVPITTLELQFAEPLEKVQVTVDGARKTPRVEKLTNSPVDHTLRLHFNPPITIRRSLDVKIT